MTTLFGDLRIALHLLRGAATRGGNHKDQLNRFYAGQANDYDDFRRRLLPGRETTVQTLCLPPDAIVVDMGGGTGANLDWLTAEQLHSIAQWHLVDLCRPLIDVAAVRTQGMRFVHLHEADAITWQPLQPVDAIIFSYSLTMIPDWRAALKNALSMLKPCGQLHVVDFHVSCEQSAFAQRFWKTWFAWDNVHLSAEHVPWLQANLQQISLQQSVTRLPLLPGSRVPWYCFSGTRA